MEDNPVPRSESDPMPDEPQDPTVDARLEHTRALARERKRRHDARKKVTRACLAETLPCNGNAPVITRRVHRVADALLSGKGPTQALESAGFRGSSTAVLETARLTLQKELSQATITRQRLFDNIVRRDVATKREYSTEGSIEVPDWTAQSASARDQVALLDRAGQLPAASNAGNGGVSITVNIVRFGDATPQDMVNTPMLDADFTSDNTETP